MHLLCTLVNVASINDPGTSASPTASRAIVSRASSTAAAAAGTRDVQRAATAAAADAVRSRPYLCGYGLVAWWGTDDMFQVHACKCFLVCRSWNDADGAVHPGARHHDVAHGPGTPHEASPLSFERISTRPAAGGTVLRRTDRASPPARGPDAVHGPWPCSCSCSRSRSCSEEEDRIDQRVGERGRPHHTRASRRHGGRAPPDRVGLRPRGTR